jgi:deazaflavin-dependent oxidoreductase (nitroreductase family)
VNFLKKTNPSLSLKISNLDGEQYLYLTTSGRRSGLPREIEIWFTCRGDRFYVIAEYPTSNWVQNLQAHPKVRVRVAGREFSAKARIPSVESERELLSEVQSLSQGKYGWSDGLVVEIIPVAATARQPAASRPPAFARGGPSPTRGLGNFRR